MAISSSTRSNLLFKPSKVRNLQGRTRVENISLSSQSNLNDQQENVGLPGRKSFFLDPLESAFQSTQQLSVDFSEFKNHTFFNSAHNKTRIAINKIVNKFPFDGKKSDIDQFIESLSGFEKYVYDIFPKNVSFLIFDGSNHLEINDFQGIGDKHVGMNFAGKGLVLDYGTGPFTIEFNLFVKKNISNDNAWICQRLSGNNENGFSIGIRNLSTDPDLAYIYFVTSNNGLFLQTEVAIKKEKMEHVSFVYDALGTQKILAYVNGELKSESENAANLGKIDFLNTKMTIGTGKNHLNIGNSFQNPMVKLKAALDNFRFFHSARTAELIKKYKSVEIYAQDDLKIHLKFNEPFGDYGNNISNNADLVLDHSGNRLHNKILNFNINQRNFKTYIPDFDNLRDSSRSPILFMNFESVKSILKDLMQKAVYYDSLNPNMITKLVPPHYITEESYVGGYDPFNEDYLEDNQPYLNAPGGAKKPENSIIISILFIWAEVFDDIKMFIDEFGRMNRVDYIENNTISGYLLPYIARQYDLELPVPFHDTTIEQYMEGRNTSIDETIGSISLLQVQNAMWRRILTDANQIRRSKGTKAGVKSVLRNVGINPYGPFRIKEYGGSKTKRIQNQYEINQITAPMLSFKPRNPTIEDQLNDGSNPKVPLFRSAFLVAERIEPGLPEVKNGEDENLLTALSWTVEGRFKLNFGNSRTTSAQSLLRMHTTGTKPPPPPPEPPPEPSPEDNIADLSIVQEANLSIEKDAYLSIGTPRIDLADLIEPPPVDTNYSVNHLVFNVVAHPPNRYERSSGRVELWGQPRKVSGNPTVKLVLNNTNLFDGNDWYVSYGRQIADNSTFLSSSYFLRVGRISSTGIVNFKEVESFFDDSGSSFLTTKDNFYNEHGAFVAIGSMSLGNNADLGLNSVGVIDARSAKIMDFTGQASHLRFFTKKLDAEEAKSHALNPNSAGVRNPKLNYNFNTIEEGSYERLRFEITFDQLNSVANVSGNLQAFDFSQNEMHGIITGAQPFANPFENNTFVMQQLNSRLEASQAENKVRARSFQSVDNIFKYDGLVAPLWELPPGEEPKDDRRVEIEASLVQALNDDMMTIFASLEAFNNYLGNPELVFAREYRDLRHLRRIYFNRLTSKIQVKTFFEFFKWFDDTVGDVLEDMIPYNSQFLGTNFVFENHALERPKFTYSYQDMYLGEIDRRAASTIKLQLFTGNIRKF